MKSLLEFCKDAVMQVFIAFIALGVIIKGLITGKWPNMDS